MNSRSLLFISLLLTPHIRAYTALPRWGQATLIINDALYVHGGKIDQFNSLGYTAAPSTADLLYLSLSQPFDLTNPPWQLVSSNTSTNISTPSSGPAVAWHSLSAYNTTQSLLFGGVITTTGTPVLPTQTDSSWLVDLFNRIAPQWKSQPADWAFQPMRRIHHASVSTPDGSVLIFGGQTSDGSGADSSAFSDLYAYNPANGGFFTLITSQGGPPGIFGHAAVILSDEGKVLIFGGVAPSLGGLVPLTTIWIYDISSSTWSLLSVSGSTIPASRRAFAAVYLGNGKVLIHGGADKDLQSSYSDGWILDTSTNPATWNRVDSLDQLGQRRDHFAVSVGSQVMFGFGYTSNSPAPAQMQIFDTSSGEFNTGFIPYSPPSSTATGTAAAPSQSNALSIGPTSTFQTIPGPSQTTRPPTTGTGTDSNVHPTHTLQPGDPTTTSNPTSGSPHDSGSSGTKRTTAIAVGTAFGVLALLAAGVGTALYLRKQRRHRESVGLFAALHDDGEDGEGSPLSTREFGQNLSNRSFANERTTMLGKPLAGVLTAFGLGNASSPSGRPSPAVLRSPQQRRDMLADEDTRNFGWAGYDTHNSSSWSLKSVIANVGAASRRMRSREASYATTASGPSTPWREKNDPFSDGAALMRDEDTGFVGAAVREPSTDYEPDPFADPNIKPYTDDDSPTDPDRGPPPRPSVHPVLPPLRTMPTSSVFPPSAAHIATLSPLTENSRSSHDTLGASTGSSLNALSKVSSFPSSQSSSLNGHSNASHAYDSTASRTSMSQHNSAGPSSPRMSLIDANSGSHIRRSDTWWSKFSRSSFLDRRNSDATRNNAEMSMDIRDPNPPPGRIQLGPIEEKPSPDSGASSANPALASLSRKNTASRGGHGSGGSMSSQRTAATANSEMIERMALGELDVVLRTRTRTGSDSVGDISRDASVSTRRTFSAHSPAPTEDSHDFILDPTEQHHNREREVVMSPESSSPRPLIRTNTNSGSAVAERIRAYERKATMDQEVPLSPSTKSSRSQEQVPRRKSHVGNYGLAPRASLYVSNPDGRTGSTDS